jgi:hypothetical protein
LIFIRYKDQNHAENQGQNAGGTLAAGGSKPPVSEEPPTNNSKNHAQDSDSGGFGDSGGILPTPVETQQERKLMRADAHLPL